MIGTQLGTIGFSRNSAKAAWGRLQGPGSHLDRSVALKVLPPEQLADPTASSGSRRKRSRVGPEPSNIVTIHDIASDAGVDYIAMEYVPGRTLDQLIHGKGMRLNDALKIAVQVADALAAAHAVGIIHRDVKPSNIMVSDEAA